MRKTPRIAVIGGGILGTLTSLGLSNLGHSCDLFEEREELWKGASFAGEGKIHLGYVYGKALNETLIPLVKGAMLFSTDLELLLQRQINWSELLTSPFRYGIPSSSLISTFEFMDQSKRISEIALRVSEGQDFHYLGKILDDEDFCVAETTTPCVYQTPERSIDVKLLRSLVLQCIAEKTSINLRTSTSVADVSGQGSCWRLVTRHKHSGCDVLEKYDYVINCSWESQSRLDSLVLHHHSDVPNLRRRLFVHGFSSGLPEALTLTLGPFGDFVVFPSGRSYASWYPTGLIGFVESIGVPPAWRLEPSEEVKREFLASVQRELRLWAPGIDLLRDATVHARIVVAHGSSDIDNSASQLHQRGGLSIFNNGEGWISVRSLKLTSAPSAALRAASVLNEELSYS